MDVTAAESALVGQVVDFVQWVGDGRKLTQKGAIALADARVLVDRLGTGDRIDPAVGRDELCELAWDAVTARYLLGAATAEQLDTARRMNDRDVGRTLTTLARLGAVTVTEDSAELTAIGRYGTRRLLGEPEPGGPVLQIIVTLADVADPPVWRRLLIPATMPLRRLHNVIQTAMGWQDSHLHCFTDGQRTYGFPDPELAFIDDRSMRFGDLDLGGGGIRYTYDFGDGWEHHIVVESVGAAKQGERYPRCIGGDGACPPEDCGGPPGYAQLRAVLADPGDEEHDGMLTWLGLDHAREFDPSAFDIEAANRRLVAVGSAR